MTYIKKNCTNLKLIDILFFHKILGPYFISHRLGPVQQIQQKKMQVRDVFIVFKLQETVQERRERE